MQFDKNNLTKILLTILFIVVVFQLLKYFNPNQRPIIIETNYENMQSVTGDYDATFYVKDNRYNTNSNNPELTPFRVNDVQKELVPQIMPSLKYENKLAKTQNCICGKGCGCNTGRECVLKSKCRCNRRFGCGRMWNTPYLAGANNTYGDAIWQYVSPRMVLDNGCLSCKGINSDNNMVPKGVASDLPPDYYDNDELTMFGNLPEVNKNI